MNNQPIGVFDSGLGGLTVMRELKRLLPNEELIYFGDTARVPYGSRSPETILKYVASDIRFLRQFNVKMIVAACGTASSVALPLLREESDIPLISVVEPAAAAAVRRTHSGPIGILGTQGTINSGAFCKAIAAIDPQMVVLQKACPMFVPLVENGYINPENPVTRLVVREYLEELCTAGVETVIMGCTHYPLLEGFLKEALPEKVSLVNMGQATAEYVKTYLIETDSARESQEPPRLRYFWSEQSKNLDMFRFDSELYDCLNQMQEIEIDGV